MEYIYSFKEINYGSITIKAENPPNESDVIEAIMNGDAFYKNTEYENITLTSKEDLTKNKDEIIKDEVPHKKVYANGYEITQEYNFGGNIGIALAENKSFLTPYTTWQYTRNPDGSRDYIWGHHFLCELNAKTDYLTRIFDRMKEINGSRLDYHRYYALREWMVYNNFPKPYGDPEKKVCFDKPAPVEHGQFKAWGYIEYHSPLSEKEIKDFGLRAAFKNPITTKEINPQKKDDAR